MGVVEQLQLAPVHRNDPDSSREAAARVKVGTQLYRVWSAIAHAGTDGISNRQIQMQTCGGFNPGHPAWNKVPTRCRTLEREGLVELVAKDGEPVLREHALGGRFLVWRIRDPRGVGEVRGGLG